MSSRYRIQNAQTNSQVTYYEFGCSSNTQTTYNAGLVGEKIETWDEKTPNFHRRIKAGEIIVNPYHNIREIRLNTINGVGTVSNTPCPPGSLNPAFAQRRDGPQLTYMLENNPSYGRLLPYWLLTSDEVNRTLGAATTEMWSRVNSATAQSLVTLAELHKTIRMLKQPLANVKKFLKNVEKQKNASKASKSLTLGKYLSNEWLTYRYGIRPMVMEIRQTLQALQKGAKRGWTRAKGYHALERTTTTPMTYSHGDIDTYYNLVRTHKFEAFCGTLFDANMATLDHLGINLSGVVPAVWELVPYSFVVDWFANVGTFLEGLQAYATARTAGSYTIHKHTIYTGRVVTGSAIVRNVGNSTLTRQMSGAEHLYYISKYRLVGVGSPSLQRNFGLQDLPVDFRILDSIGLITQKLKF